jgi:signal transduction histidine kinase
VISSAGLLCSVRVAPRTMDARAKPSLRDPQHLRRWHGAGVAAIAVAGCTAVLYPLRAIVPVDALGVLYIVVVVFVAARWGAGLGVVTTLVSAQVFNFFHLPPRYSLAPYGPSEWATLMTFVIAGLVAVMVARLSERLEAAEALREQEREARVRILAAADEERRQVARDLHDGAQQRLVHTILTLTLASQALREGDDSAPELVDEGLCHAEQAIQELRDLVHGVLPSVLTIGGLRAAVESLASRVSIPISFDVCADRLAPAVEATAYFVTAEALTNVEKHARAESAQVSASLEGDMLHVEVRDDGVGGAHLQASSGLLGLQDRVESLDGRLELHSPAGEGTVIVATLPAGRVSVADGTPPELVEVSAPNAHGAVPQGPVEGA